MSFLRQPGERRESDTTLLHEERRRSQSASVLAEASLACPHCDAPVWPGQGRRALTERLHCPYCSCTGAVRDFISLERPTRPARVVIRLRISAAGRS